jgi:hypothetical protein
MEIETKVKAWGVGWLIALIVFIICILLGFFLDKPLSNPQILGLIGALALARLL